MKIYKVICNDFGHKFSFNAKDEQDAKDKLRNYESYHSMHGAHTVEETEKEKWMHNEYVS